MTSLGGESYYMTFIDESMENVRVYFVKNKSNAFNVFRKWKTLVEIEMC